jgi:hypothetical protein
LEARIARRSSSERTLTGKKRRSGHKAFGALDPRGQAQLAADIEALAANWNRSKTTFVVPSEYLEVVIER